MASGSQKTRAKYLRTKAGKPPWKAGTPRKRNPETPSPAYRRPALAPASNRGSSACSRSRAGHRSCRRRNWPEWRCTEAPDNAVNRCRIAASVCQSGSETIPDRPLWCDSVRGWAGKSAILHVAKGARLILVDRELLIKVFELAENLKPAHSASCEHKRIAGGGEGPPKACHSARASFPERALSSHLTGRPTTPLLDYC